MDGINARAASLASRLVESNRDQRLGGKTRSDEEDLDDDDAIFAQLEEEIENDGDEALREQGLKLLREQMARNEQLRESYHGQYTEITDEKEVIRVTANEKRCVVHFYHSNFARCKIMDEHLAKIAPKYFETRFARVFVENVPWLVERLGIRVLPCVICFVDGVTKHTIVGFEELGNKDNFDTAALELRLSVCGVIQKEAKNPLQGLYKVASTSRNKEEEDEEFDL